MRFHSITVILGLLASKSLSRAVHNTDVESTHDSHDTARQFDALVESTVIERRDDTNQALRQVKRDTTNDITSSDNIDKSVKKGKQLRDDLTKARNGNSDDVKYNKAAVGKDGLGYRADDGQLRADLSFAKDLGIDITSGSWPSRTIYGGGDAIVQKVGANVDQKAAVVTASWTKNDKINKASWTQIFHENVQKLFGNSGGLGKLKYIVRYYIWDLTTTDSQGVKLNTYRAIDYAFQMVGNNGDGRQLTLDYRMPDSGTDMVVNLLCAQTHVARVLQYLKDHHKAMGNRSVSKLHLYRVTDDYDPNDKMYHITIELED
ncbi:hypothetical protein F4778DRAFT_789707 [Xylariomycetidae sp. FL2044]|nr:hypothetical protein F4778DRAFT_789707 [Xylariomycetidae sp. FL2044]